MKQTKKVWSSSKKALLVLTIGVAMVFIVNLVRYFNGEINQFYIISEGINYACVLFALGAAFIAWVSSNPDRNLFGKYVFIVGIVCAAIVGAIYSSWPVFYTFAAEGAISALLVAAIPVPYPFK